MPADDDGDDGDWNYNYICFIGKAVRVVFLLVWAITKEKRQMFNANLSDNAYVTIMALCLYAKYA